MSVEEEEYKGCTIKIEYDTDPMDPRKEFHTLGTIFALCHNRTLSDDDAEDPREWTREEQDQYISLPVYMYDHSGVLLSTTPFSCPWDSGQVGRIYVSKEKVRKEYGWKRLSEARVDNIKECLRQEIKVLSDYMSGSVYGHIVEAEDGDVIDSCWGYYGDEEIEYMLLQGRKVIDYYLEREAEDRVAEFVTSYNLPTALVAMVNHRRAG